METQVCIFRPYLDYMPTISKIRKDGVIQKFHLSPLRPQIKELYSQGLSSRKVADKLGISHVRVLAILKNENVDRRSVTKTIPNKEFEALTPERAYIFGVMCGDGCVFSGIARKKNWKYSLYVVHLSVKDRDFIDEFVRCIKSVYGFSPSIYYVKRSQKNPKWSNIWVAKITRKEVYEDLSHYKFGTKNWRVPTEVIRSHDEKVIGAFLRGFYDSEGSASKGTRGFSISICSTNKEGLNEIKELIEILKIKSSKIGINDRPSHKLFYFTISNKAGMNIFLNKINFSIKRKYDKVRKHLKWTE